jgi:hypothetical protein
MKLLIATSFRPFGFSKDNDLYQTMFINSLKGLDCNLTICATQFDDIGVENFLKKSELNYIYNNIPKNNLPPKKKYSNQKIFLRALREFCKDENDYDFFIYSTSDILLPSNLINELKKRRDFFNVSLIYPNTLIRNGKMINYYDVVYGIDIIIFRMNKTKANLFLRSLEDWQQYDWGINENFLLSVADLLKLPIFNLIKNMDLIKFENNLAEIKEDRSWQINSWNLNRMYLIDFLKKNHLSLLYAKGSYYYLLYKIFNFKDLNLRIFIIYFKIYLFYFPKALFKISNWKSFFK